MIMNIDWTTFHRKYLDKEVVYVYEAETTYDFYTANNVFIIKSSVDKEDNPEKNLIFIERVINGRLNIVKVLNVESIQPNVTINTPINSQEAVPEDQLEEELFQAGETSKDNDHYHKYSINSEGNGQTDETIGTEPHTHKIVDYIIEETEEHKHDGLK